MSSTLFAITCASLFALGLYGIVTRAGLIHRLLSANIMATSVFLFLVLVSSESPHAPDPVPQAMVLTGLVISVSLTAFALALIRSFHAVREAEADGEHRDGSDG